MNMQQHYAEIAKHTSPQPAQAPSLDTVGDDIVYSEVVTDETHVQAGSKVWYNYYDNDE